MKLTNVNDYVDKVQEKFPEISKQDIKRIITYGWKQYYLLNNYGGDVAIADRKLQTYTGYMFVDSKKHFLNYIRKLCTRIRFMFGRKKIQWDGYYYFAIGKEAYDNLMAQKKKRGRPRKHFDYGDIIAYKIFDECRLRNWAFNYIFKFRYLDMGYCRKFKNFKSDQVEFVMYHDAYKFKDILTSNAKYEFL